MIRARALILRRSITSQRVQSLSHVPTRIIGAAGAVTSSEWTSHASAACAAAAAAAGALILGHSLSKSSSENDARMTVYSPSSLARCEAVLQSEDVNNESKIRTITLQDIKEQHHRNHDVKSLRAYQAAVQNDLFRDEIKSETGAITPTTTPADNNSITERIASLPFSSVPHVNVRPRISVRHTHRSNDTDDDLGGDDIDEIEERLLATSTGIETAAPAKNYNTTLGTLAKHENEPKILNEVHLRKIKTAYGDNAMNCSDQVYTKNMYFYKSAAVMKDSVRNKFRLFALPSSESLGKEMAFLLDTELNCIDVGSYADGETNVQIGEAIRGKNVFVVCATSSATAITELLLTLSALRRGSAKRICAILPYYGYSRQDRRTGMKREPIAAADMAYLLEEMGVDSVICVDLHNALVKGFFSPEVPVDHLSPGPVAAAYFYEELFGVGEEKKEEAPKITIVAAHENQVRRANVFRNALMKLSGSDDIRVALISNTRKLNENTMSDEAQIVGDVEGRQCIIVDDIITTGSTMMKAINAVKDGGASEVYAWATHGVCHTENNVPQKLAEMDGLKYMLISNSVAEPKDKAEVVGGKIRKLSIAPLLSEAVSRALNHESIRTILDMKLGESDK